MRIACLGTSANPPHLGHSKIAQLLLHKKLVDQVWIIPSYRHALGKPLLSWKYRWAMVKMLTNKRIKACDIESKRKGKSYTVGTVLTLKKRYPQHEFYWIIGADIVQKKEYLKWHKWKQLEKSINFIVLQRPSYKLYKAPKVFSRVIKLNVPISSTEIRRRLNKNLPINRLVTSKIAKYLKYLKNRNLLIYR